MELCPCSAHHHGARQNPQLPCVRNRRCPAGAGPPGLLREGLAKKRAEKVYDRIKNRDMGDMTFGAALFELRAQIRINHTHQKNTRVSFNPSKHRIDMVDASH